MKVWEKIVGLLFAGLTFVNLLRGDWLSAAVTGMAALSMLLRERLRLPPAAEAVLGVVALALIALTLTRAFA